MSLLYDPGGLTVGPAAASTWPSRSLVEVLPEEPVMPDACAGRRRSAGACTPAASRPSAATGSATTTQGSASSGRVASAATAPAAAAAPRKSCAVDPLAGERDEQVAGGHGAGVDGDRAGHDRGRRRRRQLAADQRATSARVSPIMRPPPAPSATSRRTVAVVERVHRAGDLLAGLVALAGDEHGVAGPGEADGGGDGRPPVADLEHLGPVGRGHVGRRRPAWRRGSRRGPRSAGCRR